jgi:hypothetical protein
MDRKEKLYLAIAAILMLLSIGVSSITLAYMVSHNAQFNNDVQVAVQQELSKLPISQVDLSHLKSTVAIKGKDGSSCTVLQANSGALVNCTDGSSAYVPRGNTGVTGASGTNGQNGQTPTAIQGVAGATGATGDAGESAYQIWLDQGNTGTEQDFLASLQGPKGNDGRPLILQDDPTNCRILQKYQGSTIWSVLKDYSNTPLCTNPLLNVNAVQ